MTRPSFVVIGAMKAGTTSLAAYLGAHPDVFVTDPKEPHFFSWNWERGAGWYESLFGAGRHCAARGEASTTYTMAPHVPAVPERMAGFVPEARLVYLVRDPVARIRSQYVHHATYRGERRPLLQAVKEDPRYLDLSRYASQLEPFLARYPRERVLVVASERLLGDRRATLAEVYAFLGVDPELDIAGLDAEHNPSAAKRRLPAAAEYPRRLLARSGVNRLVPRRWRARAHRALRQGAIPAEVTPELEAYVWSALAPDLARLRELVGPAFDLWGRA